LTCTQVSSIPFLDAIRKEAVQLCDPQSFDSSSTLDNCNATFDDRLGIQNTDMMKAISTQYVTISLLVMSSVGTWICTPAVGQEAKTVAQEVRHYEILVKGKHAGSMKVVITDTDDGLTTVMTDAAVEFNAIVYTYHYDFHGNETWRGDCLISVDYRAVDGGTKLKTHADCDPHGSVVDVPGKNPQTGPMLAMTTNFWHEPISAKGSVLQVLDADQETICSTRIDEVTYDAVEFRGCKLNCTHYHLGGNLVSDLWFDGQHRLVCQQVIEDGYPTETRLTQITPGAAEVVRR
jgi:hypothetical protein